MELDQPHRETPKGGWGFTALMDKKSIRLGVGVCPLNLMGIFFSLCWMTQLKIPSFVCCNSLWFSPTLRLDNTPTTLCVGDRGEAPVVTALHGGLCRSSSITGRGQGLLGSRLHFPAGSVSPCHSCVSFFKCLRLLTGPEPCGQEHFSLSPSL